MTSRKIKLCNLDKSDWQSYRFDEIAINISERVDPNNTDLEVYIGLEHIDSGSLHIKRFGTPDDVNGQKLKFYKGDIIFGRRRAYQRKAGIATCDGFCSAHSLVLRANSDVIDPDLFPFFMHSDLFMNRAIDISVGSLSPTINWGTLREQEFFLPPKELQPVIAKLLWAMNKVLENYSVVLEKIDLTSLANVSEFFKDKKYTYNNLEKISDIRYGITLNSKRNNMPKKAPYLRVANVGRDKLNLDEIKDLGCTEDEYLRYKLCQNDVLVVEGHADIKEIGRASIWPEENTDILHQNHLIRIRVNGEIFPEVLCAYINSSFGQSYFQRNAKSTSGLNTINSTIVKQFKVPKINEVEQLNFVRRKQALDKQRALQEEQINSSISLQKSLINTVF